jgi:hypothetical protein
VHHAALVSILCVALAGCGGSAVQGGAWGSGSSGASEAQANVRAAIPALEAYFADNGTYAGATVEGLRSTYDPGILDVRIVSASATTYCVESTASGETASKAGPAADVSDGSC